MCGVAGILAKEADLEPQLGHHLSMMISALSERGPDSCGFAVYRDPEPGCDTWRLSLGADTAIDWVSLRADLGGVFGDGVSTDLTGRSVVAEVNGRLRQQVVRMLADRWPEVRVHATGRAVSVVKDVGPPGQTCQQAGLASMSGYLAVAHTRMATESAITMLHSHPFVPATDLCVVHNGSFSNHASVRRGLQRQGVNFDSDNDSEVAARLLAVRLGAGDDLKAATQHVAEKLDGFFTLVITSADGMSVVRDAFACKPAVVAETGCYVAVASEYRALAALPGITDAQVFEPIPEEVYTWKR